MCGKQQRKGSRNGFTALLNHVTVDLLRDSFYALKRKAHQESTGSHGRGMKPECRIDLSIYIAGCIVEHIGHNPHGESIYRRPMGGSVHWVSCAGR